MEAEAEVILEFWPGEEAELEFWLAEEVVHEGPWEEGAVVPQGLLYEEEAAEALGVPDFDWEVPVVQTPYALLEREEGHQIEERCPPLASWEAVEEAGVQDSLQSLPLNAFQVLG